MSLDEMFDKIVEKGIATEEEIRLVTCINGYNEDSLNAIVYARTAYQTLDQCIECEGDY